MPGVRASSKKQFKITQLAKMASKTRYSQCGGPAPGGRSGHGRAALAELPLRKFVRRNRVPVGFGIGIGAALVVGLVLALLESKWIEAGPVLKVLAVSVPFVFLSHIAGIILDAMGILRPKIVIQLLSIVVLVVMMYLWSGMGLPGFALAVVMAEIFKSIAYFWAMKSIFGFPYSGVSRIIVYIMLITVLTTAAIWITTKVATLSGLPHWGSLIMEIVIGGSSLTLLFLVTWVGLSHLQMCERINSRFPMIMQIAESFRLVPRRMGE